MCESQRIEYPTDVTRLKVGVPLRWAFKDLDNAYYAPIHDSARKESPLEIRCSIRLSCAPSGLM
jgi:hypothetical protein